MLPQINTPVFEFVLPDCRKSVKLRQILTGEYMALMKAYSLGDNTTMANTLAEIAPKCIINGNEVSMDDLSFVDMDFLFLCLYSIGVNSGIEVNMSCIKMNEDENGELKKCGHQFGIYIDLADIVPSVTEKTKIIEITDTVSMKIRYPKWKEWLLRNDESDDDVLALIVECIINGDEILTPGIDCTNDELIQWIDKLPPNKTVEMFEFIDNMPTLKWEKVVKCPSCGNEELVKIEGLEGFFD